MCGRTESNESGFPYGPAPVEMGRVCACARGTVKNFLEQHGEGLFWENTGYSTHPGNTAGSRPVSTPPLDFLP